MPEENEVVEFKRLILADGTVLNDCECGYYDDSLWCYLKNVPLTDVFRYFSIPENYYTVIFEFGTTYLYRRIKYSGFTKLKSINVNKDSIEVSVVGLDTTQEKEDVHPNGVRSENQD